MRFWFDTEFIEDGATIDLISIGIVSEDGREYYAERRECDLSRAVPWVQQNVIPHLTGETKPAAQIRDEIVAFAGEKPEFWAYYCSYDWVALCQLFGRMIDLPRGWPMFCRDLKQAAMDRGNPKLLEQTGTEHNALEDARWTAAAWELLMRDDKAGGLKDEAVATLKKQTSPEISSLAARVLGGYDPTRAEVRKLAASCLSQDEGGRVNTPKLPLIAEAREARATWPKADFQAFKEVLDEPGEYVNGPDGKPVWKSEDDGA